MSQRQTTILGVLTLAAVLVAVWLLFGERTGHEGAELRGRALFPELGERINAVATITVEGPKNTATLERSSGDWTIAEKGGYPAASGKLRDLLSALLESEIRQRKTSNPDLYERIGLGESAVTLRLLDGEGEAVARLAAGQRQRGDDGFTTFVRKGDQDRALLVDALPEIRPEASQWLPDNLLELSRSRVKAVTVEHRDAPAVRVEREAPDGEFALADKREDEQYSGYQPAGRLATAYTTLPIADVRPEGEVDLGEPQATARLAAFDGLTLEMEIFDTGDETGAVWLGLEAAYEKPSGKEGPKEMPDAPEDGQGEADRLNERAAGWLFRIESGKAGALTRKREELVEPKQEDGEGGSQSGNGGS